MSESQDMMAKIERGVRLESPDEMTPEYRENLVHLMTMQADSELAGGYGYVPWIAKAPTVEEKHVVAQIVKDELRHAAVMYGLLADLGVARVSFGPGPHSLAMTSLARAAQTLTARGDYPPELTF